MHRMRAIAKNAVIAPVYVGSMRETVFMAGDETGTRHAVRRCGSG